ncbi:LOW QUALITY PROTEIN: hypothetical protein ACHAXS_006135, partial [Conticribra weissflogii]
DVVIPQTNANLDSTKSQQLTMSEFFVFLGCIFFMACFEGVSDRREWWSSFPIDAFKGAPFCLNEYMPYRRFEDIMQALCFTNHPYPPYANQFYDEFEECGKTVSLMLQMSKNLWNTGKVVTMDRYSDNEGEWSVWPSIGEAMRSMMASAGSRFWYINEYFQDNPYGNCVTLEQVVDGVKFFIHSQKEENFVTKIMSCHGILTRVEDHDTSHDVANADGSRSQIQFKYPEPISCHNQERHWVDNTNNRRLNPIALSDVWGTKWWPNQQFTFLLEVAKANAANARGRACNMKAEPQLEFW